VRPSKIRVGSKKAADEVLRLMALARSLDSLSNESGISLEGSLALRREAEKLRDKAVAIGVPIP
jgi:hypothetical protein